MEIVGEEVDCDYGILQCSQTLLSLELVEVAIGESTDGLELDCLGVVRTESTDQLFTCSPNVM